MLRPSRHHVPALPRRILLRWRVDHPDRVHPTMRTGGVRNHAMHTNNGSHMHWLRAELKLLSQRQKPVQMLVLRPGYLRNNTLFNLRQPPVR